ncbi:MAG: AbrB/MazE/SpoVT family DNA-binding domain-containing protein [Campylobacterota bacterium]|nr:AbrB/MazE/SpoVT family DNA-binding domain-containing protein [Campylobacterota bacterium]
MEVALIDIGTSKGIRIPANILKSFDSPQSFDMRIEDDKIVLDIIHNPRYGWEEKFKHSSNELLIDDALDLDEWDEI